MNYVAPISGLKAFTCPHCNVYASQDHYYSSIHAVHWIDRQIDDMSNLPIRYNVCMHCGNICLWHFDTLVYPDRGNAPIPNCDMPDDIKKDYEEAASIHMKSPRGAAALLRLAIQKLCIHLGGEGKNINDDIRLLVKKGLDEKIQKSLDVVRVIGNNAVHPGKIDADNTEIVKKLFDLINLITEYMITMHQKVDNLYNDLPESYIESIEGQDNKKT